jgi:hypothetical protein
VVELNPTADVHPAGKVPPTVEHERPVVVLNPEADVQPAGKFPPTGNVPVDRAARDFAPKIPSAVRLLFAWNAFTAALVKLPKYPVAGLTESFVCRHVTSALLIPYFKVFVIVQSSAETDDVINAKAPTNKIATIISPRRNFDFNKLLIIFF